MIILLLSNALRQSDDVYLAACLLKACFRIRNSNSRIEFNNRNYDDEWGEVQEKQAIAVTMRGIGERRTVIYFGRCLLFGSIAGGSLLDTKSLPAATDLKIKLFRFSSCVHETDEICYTCSEKLMMAGCNSGILMLDSGRFAVAISTARSSSESASLKSLVRIIGLVVKKCMLVC